MVLSSRLRNSNDSIEDVPLDLENPHPQEDPPEDPVALEPSWDPADSRQSRLRWQHSAGTLLNAPPSPVKKTDTDCTIKRSTL